MFCQTDGSRIWPSNFNQMYRDKVIKANIPHLKLHAMRHTFVTLLVEAGEDLKVIQELVGHSSVTVTADIYAHVFDKTKRKAVSKLENLFDSALEK